MPISLKLPTIDNNPILLAETRPNKIEEFLQNLPFGDTIRAATDLIEEIQILNSQKVTFTNRMNALEQYRTTALQIYQDLLPHFSNNKLPIAKTELNYVTTAEQMWQEFALGYKAALVDLQNKILNLNASKSAAVVIYRAIHAIKEIALIHHLTYRTPSSSIWAELHQLYYCALQQNAYLILVAEKDAPNNESSVNAVYTQCLLTSLANPQHLCNQDILKIDCYLSKIATDAELRPLAYVENPLGVFLIALDGSTPPTPFIKNKDIPDGNTDILLVTVELARRIHNHLKAIQSGILPPDNCLPENAISQHYEELLSHLIKHFGKSPHRIFSRSKKSDGMELGIGIKAAHYFIPKTGNEFKNLIQPSAIIKPSRWQILNVGAGGYALRKFNSSQASLTVGDVAALKNNKTLHWELGIIRWANMNELNQLDIGLELISPNVNSILVKAINSASETEALLLPSLEALKQEATVIIFTNLCRLGDTVELVIDNEVKRVKLDKLIERTGSFERYQFSLI